MSYDLIAENSHLRTENIKLRTENKDLRSKNSILRSNNSILRDNNEELRTQLGALIHSNVNFAKKGLSTMGHCKDCKFWEHHHDTRNKEWDTCEAVDGLYYSDPVPDDGFAIYAEADDDSGLTSGLKTGPLFGCIKFKARSTQHE